MSLPSAAPSNKPVVMPDGSPGWASQPWNCTFQNGDTAWALGGNGRWRLVNVIGSSFMEDVEGRTQVAYTAIWTKDGQAMRGTFAPGCGDIKPNTAAVRRLLHDEGARCVESEDWAAVLRYDGPGVHLSGDQESEDSR
ncbi:hypothetical protein BC834DRAFT_841010 [Gloeopeniophorella convolvens]|nr:hypothetical protein BC834DRAFT_841010 [Gloeopeniophorella convolvens]